MKSNKYYLHLPNNPIGFLGKTVFFPLFIIIINIMLVVMGFSSRLGALPIIICLPIFLPLMIYLTWYNVHNFLDYFFINDNDEIVLKRYNRLVRVIPLCKIKEVRRRANYDISEGAITQRGKRSKSFAVIGYNGEIFFYVSIYENMKCFFTDNNIPFITSLE